MTKRFHEEELGELLNPALGINLPNLPPGERLEAVSPDPRNWSHQAGRVLAFCLALGAMATEFWSLGIFLGYIEKTWIFGNMNENIEEYYLGINEDQLFLQWLSDLHAHSFHQPSHFGPGTGEVALNRLPYHLARALAAKGLDKPPREFFKSLSENAFSSTFPTVATRFLGSMN